MTRRRRDDEEEEGGDYGDSGGRQGSKRPRSVFVDDEASVDDEEEEDDDGSENEDTDFIVDHVTDPQLEDDIVRMHHRPLSPLEDDGQEDVDALQRRIQARYASLSETECNEETTHVEQQTLLPCVRDPKFWMVKCKTGHEREAAVCLMQKYLDKGDELQIRSAIALDHLKDYIYVEADKEAHVKEACKGMRLIYWNSKITLLPIKEMTDVLSVKSKAIDLSRDTWVRVKKGDYKGDLAKVVNVDDVQQRVTVKLIPRIDLQALANKLAMSENEGLANDIDAGCASCRHRRQRCEEDCVMAPHFPYRMTEELKAVHKVFGIAKVTKVVRNLEPAQQKRAIDSFIWEAKAWSNDHIHGSYGEVQRLQETIKMLKEDIQQKDDLIRNISQHVLSPMVNGVANFGDDYGMLTNYDMYPIQDRGFIQNVGSNNFDNDYGSLGNGQHDTIFYSTKN